ncbi:MAG: hypothetical protein J6C23_07165 [Clostridia bacterium]|nr:hypothetical protein [Clostridia bacterium]
MKTKSIAYVAVFCALAVAISALVHYVIPAKTAPLALISLIGLVAFSLTGWGGGIAFVAVTGILTFVFTGLSVTFFALAVVFLPYSVIAYALKKLSYTNKTVFIRAPVVFVFFFVNALLLMTLSALVTGAQSALYEVQGKIGIWFTALLFAMICLPADFLLSSVAVIVSDRLNKTKKR